jgi:hypothetical protein
MEREKERRVGWYLNFELFMNLKTKTSTKNHATEYECST